MNQLDISTGAFRRAAGIGQQIQETDLSLKLESAGSIHCSDHCDRFRVVFLDENIDLRIPHVGEIERGNIASKFTFSPARSWYGIADERHANIAVLLNPQGLSRQLRKLIDANLQHVARADP